MSLSMRICPAIEFLSVALWFLSVVLWFLSVAGGAGCECAACERAASKNVSIWRLWQRYLLWRRRWLWLCRVVLFFGRWRVDSLVSDECCPQPHGTLTATDILFGCSLRLPVAGLFQLLGGAARINHERSTCSPQAVKKYNVLHQVDSVSSQTRQ